MSVISEDLNMVVLEKEYPRLKEALEMQYSEVGYDELKRAINEISSCTFSAMRIVARLNEQFVNFTITVYNAGYGQIREKAIKRLETIWKEEKRKTTLTEKRIDDCIYAHFHSEILPLEKKKLEYETQLKVVTGLYKRLESREMLLQTYSRLFEKRAQFTLNERKGE